MHTWLYHTCLPVSKNADIEPIQRWLDKLRDLFKDMFLITRLVEYFVKVEVKVCCSFLGACDVLEQVNSKFVVFKVVSMVMVMFVKF